MRIRIVTASVAVLSVLGTAACGAGTRSSADTSSSTHPTRSPSGPAFPQLTADEAKQHLTAYMTTNNRANTTLDDKLLGQIETGAILAIDQADFRARKSTKLSPYVKADLLDVTVYPVRVGAYPRWFVVRSHWKDTGKAVDKGWKYDLFAQQAAGAPWLDIAGPNEYDNATGPEPQIKTDADGLATEVPVDATDLLIAPRDLAANYAADLMDKRLPHPEAQFTVNADDWPAYAAKERQNDGDSATVTDTAAPATQYPTHAVRTVDGGALVDTTVTYNERYDIFPGRWVSDGAGDGFLPKDHHYTHYIERDRLLNVLVYVPPASASGGELRVIGAYEGTLKADAR